MAHAQKSDFVFRQNGRVHLNRRGLQFSRLLTAEVCASAVLILDTPCSEVVWRVLAANSIRHFPLLFSSRASSCAITFQLESTYCGQYVAQWGYGLEDLCGNELFLSFTASSEPRIQRILRLCSTINRPWREADHLSPFSAEVRAWKLSTTLCSVVHRVNFSYVLQNNDRMIKWRGLKQTGRMAEKCRQVRQRWVLVKILKGRDH
jgi:hypothetical protein